MSALPSARTSDGFAQMTASRPETAVHANRGNREEGQESDNRCIRKEAHAIPSKRMFAELRSAACIQLPLRLEPVGG